MRLGDGGGPELMLWRNVAFLTLVLTSVPRLSSAAECSNSAAKKINLDQWSTRSILSPDQQWEFASVGPKSTDQKAPIFIRNLRSSVKWPVGSIERNGTAFWSDDSKRLFLRDEYAADDTKIRVFDVSGSRPRKVKGLDDKVRMAISSRIPNDETTQWLYYPQVCFAKNDSSTAILVADAPVVRKRGNSEGKSFRLKLTINLVLSKSWHQGQKPPRFP